MLLWPLVLPGTVLFATAQRTWKQNQFSLKPVPEYSELRDHAHLSDPSPLLPTLPTTQQLPGIQRTHESSFQEPGSNAEPVFNQHHTDLIRVGET